MDFRITGLSPEQFAPFMGLDARELARRGARRVIADRERGFPDRIELREANPGESVLLVNYLHQPAATPYRSSHAIYVLEGASRRYDRINEVPALFRTRVMSVRAFDHDDMMIDADIAAGTELEGLIERLLADSRTSYLHAHYAKHGCFAAHIGRA
ncbi:MAG: DUF1203 domain-containing protein [Gammaproteobacteria bacterium]|nr:DUF1203 domain-containing protein [Gammaproteobacteria bacterium]